METFVVRIFVPADNAELDLTGLVEHIGTRRVRAFRGEQGLVDLVLHGLDFEQTGETGEEDDQ